MSIGPQDRKRLDQVLGKTGVFQREGVFIMLSKLDGESSPDRFMTGLCRGFVQELTSPSGDSSWDSRQEISVKLSNVCSILQIGLVTTQHPHLLFSLANYITSGPMFLAGLCPSRTTSDSSTSSFNVFIRKRRCRRLTLLAMC